MADTAPSIKLHCNECANNTKHLIISQHVKRFVTENDVDVRKEYNIVSCAGCEEIHFVYRLIWSGDVLTPDVLSDDERWDVSSYPPRLARKIPKWIDDLEKDVRDALLETYAALQNDLRRFAVIGTRTVLEMVMVEAVGDEGSFTKTIKKFADAGYIAPKSVEYFKKTLDAGSASAHRGFQPDTKTLGEIFDLVEALIFSTYVQQKRADAVEAVTPKRKKRTVH